MSDGEVVKLFVFYKGSYTNWLINLPDIGVGWVERSKTQYFALAFGFAKDVQPNRLGLDRS